MKKPNSLNLKDKEKSVKRNKTVKSNFEKRKEDYNKLKNLRQVLKAKKEEKIEELRRDRKRIEANRKRKEENNFKSGKFDIVSYLILFKTNNFQIKNPTKIKKWSKKARQTLQKMPADLFYEKYGK